MLVKTIKYGNRGRKTHEYPCTHIALEEYEGGIHFEICGGPPTVPTMIEMPQQCDEFYVMDDGGNTQDSWKWTAILAKRRANAATSPRQASKEARA
jgi:hypothetical protein